MPRPATDGLIGVFNGGGRIAWASASDYLGRTATYATFFVLQVATFVLVPQISNVWVFEGLLFLVITCDGGGFACLLAYLGDLFDTRELGAIHGYTLTAWGLAGVAGPALVARIVESTGSYAMSFYVITTTLVVGLLCTVLLRRNINSIRDSQESTSSSAPSPTDVPDDRPTKFFFRTNLERNLAGRLS